MSNISRFIGNERGDKICHEDDGCPTELAVLKRFWREQQASTLPEEVANLVELLDEEEVPYEDSLGVALSLTGRTKQYANGKTATLREQVEKLTKERDALVDAIDNEMVVTHMGVFNPGDDPKVALNKICCYAQDLGKFFAEDACKEQLLALAEQNEKMRKVLLRLACLGNGDQYGNSIGNCIAQEALSLPDLASPVLNRIRAEAMEMAAKWFNDHVDNRTDTWQAQELRRMAAELEKTND